MSEPRPAAAAAFAASAAGDLYRLPGSGLVARLRRPSLIALAAGPGVPNPILRLLAVDSGADPTSDAEKMELYRRQTRAFTEIAALAFVEPRLVLDREPNPDAGEISPTWLTDRDLIWIYYDLVQGGADAVAPFRVAAESPAPHAPGA